MFALKLLGIANWLKGAMWRIAGWVGRNPREAAIIALVALSALFWRGKQSALSERDAARAETTRAIEAGQQALAAQIKLHNETKAAYAAAAKEADNDYAKDLAAANGAAARYAAANRVRGEARIDRADQAGSGAENSDPGTPEGPTAETFVAITRADFDKCTALYPYASSVYQWGVKLREAGLAE